jgi:carbamoyltransferase
VNAAIAASLQDRLERAAIWYVRVLFTLAPTTKRLCLAGGVALNVKMNRAIWESGIAERIWIQPAAGDMGNVLGAAWLRYVEVTGKRPEPMQDLYLGPSYDDAAIKASLDASQLLYEKKSDIADAVAELLAKGKIVAWHQGRSEFGPRALGARSVLAHPGRAETKEDINIKIKFREPFRPFCPSFLEGHGDELFEHYMTSPYMVMTFRAKKEWRDRIPAVVHIDGTVRPQEVFERTNPAYARLIGAFYRKTGIPIILNTSLNVKGEPIVDTPEQAINFFNKTRVEALAIGDYLVVR